MKVADDGKKNGRFCSPNFPLQICYNSDFQKIYYVESFISAAIVHVAIIFGSLITELI